MIDLKSELMKRLEENGMEFDFLCLERLPEEELETSCYSSRGFNPHLLIEQRVHGKVEAATCVPWDVVKRALMVHRDRQVAYRNRNRSQRRSNN